MPIFPSVLQHVYMHSHFKHEILHEHCLHAYYLRLGLFMQSTISMQLTFTLPWVMIKNTTRGHHAKWRLIFIHLCIYQSVLVKDTPSYILPDMALSQSSIFWLSFSHRDSMHKKIHVFQPLRQAIMGLFCTQDIWNGHPKLAITLHTRLLLSALCVHYYNLIRVRRWQSKDGKMTKRNTSTN